MAFMVSVTEEGARGKSHASFSKRWRGNDMGLFHTHAAGYRESCGPVRSSEGWVSTVAGQVNTSLAHVDCSTNPCCDFWLDPVASGNEPGRENGEKLDGNFALRLLTCI